MVTDGGGGGLIRLREVLGPLKVGTIAPGRRKVALSSMRRGKAAFTRGTFLGTGTTCLGAKLPTITSSSNLYISTLSNEPNICATHCNNRNLASRRECVGLLSRVGGISSSGHSTRFASSVYYVLPSNSGVATRNVYRNGVNCRPVNGSKFNCSPVFVFNSGDFTRLSTRRGSTMDRQKGTLARLGTGLRGCFGGG